MESRKPAVDVRCARLFRMGRVRREVGRLVAEPGVKFSGRLAVGGPLVNRPSEGLSSEQAGKMVDAAAVLKSKIMAGIALVSFIEC
jgi:hypothetical protein